MTACKSVQEWLQPAKPLLIVRWALWESRLEANGELNSWKQILTFVGIATDTSEPHLTQVHWLLSSHQFVNSCRTHSCFHSRTFRMTSYPWQLTWKNFSTRYNFAFLEVFEMKQWNENVYLLPIGNWIPTPHDMPGFRGSAGWFPGRQQNVMDADKATSTLQNYCVLHKVSEYKRHGRQTEIFCELCLSNLTRKPTTCSSDLIKRSSI